MKHIKVEETAIVINPCHRIRGSYFLTGAVWLASFLTPASQSLGATLTLTGNSDNSWWLANVPERETPLAEATKLPLSPLLLDKIAEVTTGKLPVDLMAANPSAPLFNFSQSQPSSSNRSPFLQSLVESLSQLRWDLDRKNAKTEVPRLPQTTIADVYKDVYEFRASSAGNGNQSGSLDSFQFFIPFFPLNGTTASRSAARPSLNASKAGAFNSEVNVTFPSQPKTEIEDIDTFLRTRYRTRLSDMIERINKSLKTKVDVNLPSMPKTVFSNPYQPHSSSFYYNQPAPVKPFN